MLLDREVSFTSFVVIIPKLMRQKLFAFDTDFLHGKKISCSQFGF